MKSWLRAGAASDKAENYLHESSLGQQGHLVETAISLIMKAHDVLSVGNFVHHKDGFAIVFWLIFSTFHSSFNLLNISNSLPVHSSWPDYLELGNTSDLDLLLQGVVASETGVKTNSRA